MPGPAELAAHHRDVRISLSRPDDEEMGPRVTLDSARYSKGE